MLHRTIKRLAAMACVIAVMAALSGCSSTAGVTIATLDTPENILLGEVIAQQLEQFNFEVARGARYPGLMALETGMRANEFDISGLFIQDALSGLIGERPIFDQVLAQEIVGNTLQDMFGFTLLDGWNIGGGYTVAIHQDLRFGLAELPRYSHSLTLAATQDFVDGIGGLAHLRELFGELEFANIIIVHEADFYNTAQIGADVLAMRTFMIGDWLRDSGYISTQTEFSVWPVNNFVPIIDEDILDRHPEIRTILSSIAFQIDADRFAEKLHSIERGETTFEDAATEILQFRR